MFVFVERSTLTKLWLLMFAVGGMVGAPKTHENYQIAWRDSGPSQTMVWHNTSSIETFHYHVGLSMCCTHRHRHGIAWKPICFSAEKGCTQPIPHRTHPPPNPSQNDETLSKRQKFLLIAPQNAKLYVPNGYNRLCYFFFVHARHSWSRYQFKIFQNRSQFAK
jgi:hypothetical protein